MNIAALKLMNNTMITYLADMGESTERNEIIAEILNDENCFNVLTKEDAFIVLEDIGVSPENLEEVYESVCESANE